MPYNVVETYAELQAALTDHLIQEGTTDLHNADARQRAINRAYFQITQALGIWRRTASSTLDTTLTYQRILLPSDFASLSGGDLYVNRQEVQFMDEWAATRLDPNYADPQKREVGDRAAFAFYSFVEDGTPRAITVLPWLRTQPAQYSLRYHARPPALLVNADLPWAGLYPDWHDLISTFAAHLVFRDKGPEFYQASRFWLSEYERREMQFKKELARQQRSPRRMKIGHTNSPRKGMMFDE